MLTEAPPSACPVAHVLLPTCHLSQVGEAETGCVCLVGSPGFLNASAGLGNSEQSRN